MVDILANGYLQFTGNKVFDFYFSWIGFFHVAGWSIGTIVNLIKRTWR